MRGAESPIFAVFTDACGHVCIVATLQFPTLFPTKRAKIGKSVIVRLCSAVGMRSVQAVSGLAIDRADASDQVQGSRGGQVMQGLQIGGKGCCRECKFAGLACRSAVKAVAGNADDAGRADDARQRSRLLPIMQECGIADQRLRQFPGLQMMQGGQMMQGSGQGCCR